MIDFRPYLACPDCGASIENQPESKPAPGAAVSGEGDGSRRACGDCGRSYVLFDGPTPRARFLSGDEAEAASLNTVDGREMARGYRRPSPWVARARKLITSEFFPGKAWRRAKRDAFERAPVLVIGSGVSRFSGAVHLDIDDFPGVDVVADAQRLPFRDQVFEGVLCEVVLEHVRRPEEVIAEAHRVLKTGGKGYFVVPFLFPYHGHPDDFQRWSREGCRQAFRDFSRVEVGIHGGPASGLVNILSEWIYAALGFRFPRMYAPVKGVATALLFPLKFLDLWINRRPEAHRLAATFYIAVEK